MFFVHTRIYTHMRDPDYYCYRLGYWMSYDPEDVWELVQRHNGYMSIHPGGSYEFHIHRDHHTLLLIAFPELSRQSQKDLYVGPFTE